MAKDYTIYKEPKEKKLTRDAMWVSSQKAIVYGMKEYDVTDGLKKLRQFKGEHNVALSSSTYLIWCVAKALEEMPWANAYRDWRGRIYEFKDADVMLIMEFNKNGKKVLLPRIFRKVNKMKPTEFEAAIKAEHNKGYKPTANEYFFMSLPTFLRRMFLRLFLMYPPWFKEYFGTMGATSLLIGGLKDFTGIPRPLHTSSIFIYSKSKKNSIATTGEVETKDYVNFTFCMDHNIVDGTNMVRFTRKLEKIVRKIQFE